MAWKYSLSGTKTRTYEKRGYLGKVYIQSNRKEPYNIWHETIVNGVKTTTHIRSCVRWFWVARWIANRWLRQQR